MQTKDAKIQLTEKLFGKYLATMINFNGSASVRLFGIRLAGLKRYIGYDLPTIAVNGRDIFINPNFLLNRSHADNYFTLMHEAFHVIARHSERLRDALPHLRELVHHAADYSVNGHLVQDRSNPFAMPEDGLYRPDLVSPDGRTLNVERIIPILVSELPPPPPIGQSGEGEGEGEGDQDNQPGQGGADSNSQDENDQGGDDSADNETGDTDHNDDAEGDSGNDQDDSSQGDDDNDGGDGGDDSQDSSQDNGSNGGSGPDAGGEKQKPPLSTGELLPAPDDFDPEEAVAQTVHAAKLAKLAGNEGAALVDELLTEALTPQPPDWITTLKQLFARVADTSDYSYRKFNNRYAHFGLIAPTLYTDGIGKVAIVGDESGSMSMDQIAHISQVTIDLLADWNPREIEIIRHTSRIVYTETLYRGMEPATRAKRATGGTSFQPVLDYLESDPPDVVVWVTDCMPFDNPREPNYPVVFVSVDPHGEHYHKQYIGGWGHFVQVD